LAVSGALKRPAALKPARYQSTEHFRIFRKFFFFFFFPRGGGGGGTIGAQAQATPANRPEELAPVTDFAVANVEEVDGQASPSK